MDKVYLVLGIIFLSVGIVSFVLSNFSHDISSLVFFICGFFESVIGLSMIYYSWYSIKMVDIENQNSSDKP